MGDDESRETTSHRKMKLNIKRIACRLLVAVCWLYITMLLAWLVAYLATGDRYGYIGLATLVADNFFFPLPLVALLALACRARRLWVGIALAALAFIWLWGGHFYPRSRPAQASEPALTVMTYNVLAWHDHVQPVLATIRFENADIVFLQELNNGLAAALQNELAEEYPYQVLQPLNNPSGIGIISKIPISETNIRLPSNWIGGPIVVTATWQGQAITLVDFHMYPTTRIASPAATERVLRTREAQARLLVEAAQANSPMILGGDANTVPLSDSYQILTGELQDSWREAGFGLGHTFPGSTIPESDRPHLGSWYVPAWLARIDYIFHTRQWETVSARLAQFDQVSDHRGVVAVLRLRK